MKDSCHKYLRIAKSVSQNIVDLLAQATMPTSVEKLAQNYLRCPATVSIGDEESHFNKRIHQSVQFVKESSKKKKLFQMLGTADPPIIVFVNSKAGADVLGRTLDRAGFPSIVLHGGKSQDQRKLALNQFKEGM